MFNILSIMKFNKFYLGSALVGLIVLLNACKAEDDKPFDNYASGVFITNEGKFSGGTGTVDFYDRTIGGIKNDIFAKENNGASIGNILQSMGFNNDTAYLVVNNANKVSTVNYKSFKSIATISGFTLPRYYLNINSAFGYVSDWGANGLTGSIKVLDYATKTIAKSIPTGKGTDKMVLLGNSVWVVNSGGFGKDSTISIVSTISDTVLTNIQVGLGPNSIVQDGNGDVWVLCGGYFDRSESGKLVKIRNSKVEYTFDVPKGASALVTDASKSILYFIANGKIYKKDIANFGANPPSVFMTQSYFRTPYSLGVDTKSGYLYCTDAKDYSSEGKLYIFDPQTKALKDSVKTGIVPGNIYFF
jgi:hypothetical protein